MRTTFVLQPTTRRLAVFAVLALVASLLLFVPPAGACVQGLRITKVESGHLAPATPATYTIHIEEVGNPSNSVDVDITGGETRDVDLAAGVYDLTEVDPGPGVVVNFAPADRITVPTWQVVEVTAYNHYPAGKIEIHKVETGSAALGDSYTFELTGPTEWADPQTHTLVVPANGKATTGWLPLGTYDLQELNEPSGASYPSQVELVEDTLTVTVEAENPYPAGKLSIQKVETGSAAPGETYLFEIDGPSGYHEEIALGDGDVWMSGWLELGEYTITELGDPDADISPNPVTIDEDGETVEVLATNPYPAGKLSIKKVETGPLAPGETYTFAVDGPDDGEEADFLVDVAAGDTWTSGWLEPGEYRITELGDPDADISPNPVTVSDSTEPVLVTATNPYPAGKLSIEKVETGSAAPGETYTFQVDGPGDNDFDVTVAAGETWMSGWLPLGEYTITEVDAPEGATISPNPVTIDEDGETVLVEAVNPYPAAKLSIEKVETGGAAPGGTYTFQVDGPGDNDFDVVVKAGETWTSGWLPLGEYTITEVDAPEGATISPNPVTIDEDGETVLVEATNPYPVAEVLPAAVQAPVVQPAAVQAAPLPVTGAATSPLVLVAVGLLLTGLATTAVSRRLRSPVPF